jgi:hypothetical protein
MPSTGGCAWPGAGERLVMTLAALAGELDLADIAAAAMLRDRLTRHARDADPAVDVMLTGAEEHAYQETRIDQMGRQGDPLGPPTDGALRKRLGCPWMAPRPKGRRARSGRGLT